MKRVVVLLNYHQLLQIVQHYFLHLIGMGLVYRFLLLVLQEMILYSVITVISRGIHGRLVGSFIVLHQEVEGIARVIEAVILVSREDVGLTLMLISPVL